MKKFRFRFEKILGYRRHQETQKQRELASVRAIENRQKRHISGIIDDRARAQGEQSAFLTGQIDPGRLVGYSRYYLKLKQMEMTGRQVLAEIGRRAEEKRLELVDATRQKKIYEKLRERHLDQHTREVNLLMQKENDEIGQQVFLQHR